MRIGVDRILHLGCGPGGTAFATKWGAPNLPVRLDDREQQRRRQGSIRFFPDQSRDQERPPRPLCSDWATPTRAPSTPACPMAWVRSQVPPTFHCRAQEGTTGRLSVLNLNHQFTASVTYDLPFGKGKQFGSNWNGAVNAILGNWEVDVIERVTSGFPALRR